MTIKEVEQILSVSRANIRFYEKEGLLTTIRKSNNYRDYSEENVQELKKIILFRKLGFTVDEIKKMQSGDLAFDVAASDNISRLENEIESLNDALKLTKRIADEHSDFQTLDENYYFDILVSEEKNGAKFVDILKDYLMFQIKSFDIMWKYVFFHDFEKERKKYGVIGCIISLLLICVIRGIAREFIWRSGTFWEGFLYPFVIFLVASIIITPLYILSKKAPEVASVIAGIVALIGIIFIGGLILFIIVLFLNSVFHFLY